MLPVEPITPQKRKYYRDHTDSTARTRQVSFSNLQPFHPLIQKTGRPDARATSRFPHAGAPSRPPTRSRAIHPHTTIHHENAHIRDPFHARAPEPLL